MTLGAARVRNLEDSRLERLSMSQYISPSGGSATSAGVRLLWRPGRPAVACKTSFGGSEMATRMSDRWRPAGRCPNRQVSRRQANDRPPDAPSGAHPAVAIHRRDGAVGPGDPHATAAVPTGPPRRGRSAERQARAPNAAERRHSDLARTGPLPRRISRCQQESRRTTIGG